MRRLKRKITGTKFMLPCAVFLIVFCSPPRQNSAYSSQEPAQELKSQYQKTTGMTESGGIRFGGGDGSSMEKAILIAGAKNEIEAVQAEIGYISGMHGQRDRSWKMIMQNNFRKDGRVYVEYQTEDLTKGTKAAYFFDHTSLYSAFLKETGAPPAPAPERPEPTPEQKETGLNSQPVVAATERGEVRFGGGDGSSMEKAIILTGPGNEKEALQAEIDYISRRHGEKDRVWKIILKSNFRKKFRHYRLFTVKDLSRGERFYYYFDVTDVFDR